MGASVSTRGRGDHGGHKQTLQRALDCGLWGRVGRPAQKFRKIPSFWASPMVKANLPGEQGGLILHPTMRLDG